MFFSLFEAYLGQVEPPLCAKRGTFLVRVCPGTTVTRKGKCLHSHFLTCPRGLEEVPTFRLRPPLPIPSMAQYAVHSTALPAAVESLVHQDRAYSHRLRYSKYIEGASLHCVPAVAATHPETSCLTMGRRFAMFAIFFACGVAIPRQKCAQLVPSPKTSVCLPMHAVAEPLPKVSVGFFSCFGSWCSCSLCACGPHCLPLSESHLFMGKCYPHHHHHNRHRNCYCGKNACTKPRGLALAWSVFDRQCVGPLFRAVEVVQAVD